MKKYLFNILLAAAAADGNGPAPKPPEKETSAVKSGMVKVRAAGTQPINVDGTILEPAVLNKKGVTVKEAPVVEIHEKHLKRLGDMVTKVALLIGLLLLGGFTAMSQQYSYTYVPITNGSTVRFTGSLTNQTGATLAAGATNTMNVIIPVTKYGDLGLYFGSKALSASTSNNIVYVDQGLDATNFWPLAQISWSDNGTATAGNGTNITLGAVGYVRITQWASSTAIVVKTNLIGEYSFKPSRLGN